MKHAKIGALVCGIVGIVSQQPVAQSIYDALIVLQHRGQDAAGIMTDANGTLYTKHTIPYTSICTLKQFQDVLLTSQ